MVGAPGQTLEYLAQDLLFLKDLEPEMAELAHSSPIRPHGLPEKKPEVWS